MKGSIILNKKINTEDNFDIDYNFMNMGEDEYLFNIYIDDQSIEKIYSDVNTIKEELIERIDFLKEDGSDASFYEENIDKLEELIINTETISLNFSFEEAANYIKNNPSIKSKKIIIVGEDVRNLELDGLYKMKNILGDDVSCVSFSLNKYDKLVSYDEFRKTAEKANELIKNVNSLDLSPIEKIMFIYDIVRDREYKKENENESKGLSRDISSALLGENIVCEGYANIFSKLLEKVGIHSRVVYLLNRGEKTGHARNMIYVKDDKYDIDGIYYFDATGDSKNRDSDDFLYTYKYFGLNRKEITEQDILRGHDFIEQGVLIDTDDLSLSLSEIDEIIEEEGLRSIPEELLKTANHFSHITSESNIMGVACLNPILPDVMLPSKELVQRKLFSLINKLDDTISLETLIKIAYNVRKVEYYLNPEKYPFDTGTFYCIGLNSTKKLEKRYLSREEKLFNTLFGNQPMLKAIDDKRNCLNYINEEEMPKKIGRVRVAKALRLVCDKKKEEN